MLCALPAAFQTPAQTPSPVSAHDLAARIDSHYNRLRSFRATFHQSYTGMGIHRDESGTLLLRKPGRMRWSYSSGKLFVLDGRNAISYTPGDAQAQRLPAKQMDDLRSPLRFLLGHTQLEKELDHIAVSSANGAMTISGVPRFSDGSGSQRIAKITLTANPQTGSIGALTIDEIDGSSTAFTFGDVQENVPATDADFRFTPPAGVTIVDGTTPL